MSKQVMSSLIQFIDGALQEFNVLTPTNRDIIKYTGRIQGINAHLKDYCTCMSFTMRNTLAFELLHNFSFQCKHIKRAREIRFEGYS